MFINIFYNTFWISFSKTPSVMNLILVSLVTFPSYRIWYETTLNTDTKQARLHLINVSVIIKTFITPRKYKKIICVLSQKYIQFVTVWTGSSLWPLCGTCWQQPLFLALWYQLFRCRCRKQGDDSHYMISLFIPGKYRPTWRSRLHTGTEELE